MAEDHPLRSPKRAWRSKMATHSPAFGYLLVLFAASLWATLGIFYKTLISTFGLQPLAVVFWRALIAAIALFVFLAMKKRDGLRIQKRDLPFFVLFGLVGVALFYVVYVNAVALTGMGVAAVLMYTAPVWVTGISVLFLGERLDRRKGFALVLAVGGGALVGRIYDLEGVRLNLTGILAGIAAGLTYGLYILFSKAAARRQYNPWTTLAYALGLGALFLLPMQTRADFSRVLTTPPILFWLLGIGLVPTLAGGLAFNAAMLRVPASNASIMATLEPVIATILGWAIFAERLDALQILGGILIGNAVIILQIQQMNWKDQKKAQGPSDIAYPQKAREALATTGIGDIRYKAQAHWLTAGRLAWPIHYGHKAIYRLHYDPLGAIQVTPAGLEGGQSFDLEFIDDKLNPALASKFPYLRQAIELKIPDKFLEEVPEILTGQFAISVSSPEGAILAATALQIPGVLDDLYANDEPLGVLWEGNIPALRVWAPTAQSVTVYLFADSNPKTTGVPFPMERDAKAGVWRLTGEAGWKYQFYLYEVEVFVRQEGKVVHNLVTDPYSLSLAMNSARSQIVDLDDPELQPEGWSVLSKPPLLAPEDIVLYELHVRDFSALDASVPEAHRGTFLAFTDFSSNGMCHLQRLAEAGMTHVHLLPVFDFSTIQENREEWLSPDYELLSKLPPDSERQQAEVTAIRDRDGYNWGYDPLHYTVPEGSYATDPDGPTRILEFRQMVKALNQAGLRVVMDVTYNHTHASGQSQGSVLDRIVPGYYHRLNPDGNVETSTCCANTATEHAMMEKLMVDSVRTWARDYKVDGFRFDLMGHHMVRNMQTVREELDALDPETDGVEGQSIYIYGEGWNFGEVANNARGVNATQSNLGGSGIGTFNDRVRDAVRGGGPFRGVQEQGFITGLFTDPNSAEQLPLYTQAAKLLELTDLVRLSLAGNLAGYRFINYEGREISGEEARYNGQPAAYTHDPQENIVYIAAHDNETLFDAIQYKAPLAATLNDRVRMQNLGLSLVALSQGIPFFSAGSEILQSKSMDRDSYDSGDWFNHLDFTYTSNNWGIGLPPKDKNEPNWPVMRTLLGRPELKPTTEHILATLSHFEEILQIRRSSRLFRLQTAAEIIRQVRFYNTGPQQIPGLIVMAISDDPITPLDDQFETVVILFNAGKETGFFRIEHYQDKALFLHPIQAASADPVVRMAEFDPITGTFTIPGRTTAVFVAQDIVPRQWLKK